MMDTHFQKWPKNKKSEISWLFKILRISIIEN